MVHVEKALGHPDGRGAVRFSRSSPRQGRMLGVEAFFTIRGSGRSKVDPKLRCAAATSGKHGVAERRVPRRGQGFRSTSPRPVLQQEMEKGRLQKLVKDFAKEVR